MHRDILILVCHDADGHFADGNRHAVYNVLAHAEYIAGLEQIDNLKQLVTCRDGGHVVLRAPGLDGQRTFHRIELYLESGNCTEHLLALVFDLMQHGGFGLLDGVDVPQFIVTQPQQVSHFPWLPQPPILVRSVRDLAQVLI